MTDAGNRASSESMQDASNPLATPSLGSSGLGTSDGSASTSEFDQLRAARDATEAANRRLRETLERISAAFFAFDPDWRLVYVNQRASDLWRVPLTDRIGERLWDVSPNWDESVFGKRVLATIAEGPEGRFDHWNKRLERWLDVQVYSSEEGVTLFIEDVTERRRQEFRQRFIAEASAVLAGSLDLDVTLQNLAALCVGQIADFCLVDAISEPGRVSRTVIAHQDSVQRARIEEFRKRFPFNHDAEFGPGLVFRTRQSRLYSQIDDVTKDRMRADHGRLDGFLELGFQSAIVVPMISRSIPQGVLSLVSTTPGHFKQDDLQLAEELATRAGAAIDNARLYRSAQTAVQAREAFLSIAAHELRTPITSIKGFAGLVQREASGNNNPERVLRYVHRLNDAAGRLSMLVEDLLDESRVRSGQILLRPERFDLAVLIGQIIERTLDQHANDALRIDFQGVQAEAWLVADDDRIEQVLSNVIDNAIKYSPPGEPITIRLEPTENGWEVSVEDHGIGIPKGSEDLIFETFGRAANVRDANASGLGIGLSISRGIIERHGGSIWTESQGEGHGTTMRFRLPAQPLD